MSTIELEPAVGAGVANLLGVVADNKYWLGRHLSQWAVGTPGLESAVSCAAIAQGHLGQSRAVRPIADELAGEDVDLGRPEQGDQRRRYNVTALDEGFDTWVEAVGTLFLIDPALDTVMRSLGGVADELDRRVARVLDESSFNFDFARGRLVELCTAWPGTHDELVGVLRRVLPEALCWFGPAGERGVGALVEAEVLTRDNEQMRQAYLDLLAPTLRAHDLDVGIGGEQGEWTYEELPWDRWTSLTRRLDG